MSLNQPETQALGSIADGLAGSDPRLASMLTILSRLAADEDMPARERTRVRRRRAAAHRPRRARRHSRRGMAFPQPRRLYARLGRQQAMLVLWAVISAALLTAALILTASGLKTCARPMGTACPSPSITRMPARANADAPRALSMSMNAKGWRPWLTADRPLRQSGIADQHGYRRDAPVPPGPAWLAKPTSAKLAGAGWLPVAVGRDRARFSA